MEAHNYEFTLSPHDIRRTACLLLLWPGLSAFQPEWRSGRLIEILYQGSKNIVHMTGSDLGFGDD